MKSRDFSSEDRMDMSAWLLAVFALTLPFTHALSRVNLFILVLPFGLLLRNQADRKEVIPRLRAVCGSVLPLLGFTFLLSIQCFRSPSMLLAQEQYSNWVPGIALALLCSVLTITVRRFQIISAGLIGGACIGSLYGGYQVLFKGFATFPGPLMNSNVFGGLLAVVIPIALAWMFDERRAAIRTLLIAATLLMYAAMALTRCRGSLLAIILAFVFLSWAFRKFWLAPVALILYGLCDVIVPGLLQRALTTFHSPVAIDDSGSIGERLRLWLAGWRLFRSSPLLGGGTGSFRILAPLQHVRGLWLDGSGWTLNCHNSYLQLLAEQGLAGFALFSWSALQGAMMGIRRYLKGRDFWVTGLLGSLIAFSTQNLTNSLLAGSFISWAGWLVFGLTLSAYAQSAPIEHARSRQNAGARTNTMA